MNSPIHCFETLLALILCLVPLSSCGEDGAGKDAGDKGIEATCTLDADNALRGTCAVTLEEPAAIELDMRVAEVHLRFESPEVSSTHSLFFFGLIALEEVSWELSTTGEAGSVRRTSGHFNTPALPEEAVVATTVRRPGEGTVAQVWAPQDCGSSPVVDLFDAMGRIRWYQSFDPDDMASPPEPGAFKTVEGLRWTAEGTMLGIVGRSRIAEYDLSGHELMALHYGIDFDRPVHHDLVRHAGLLYTIEAYEIPFEDSTAVTDGIVVFDSAGGIVSRWDILEHHPLPADVTIDHSQYWTDWFATPIDLLHANSISIDTEGEWLLSLRNTNELLSVNGNTGALSWSLSGSGEGSLSLRSEAAWEARFAAQHDATWQSAGHIRLFDNGEIGDGDTPTNSAALDLRLDLDAGEAGEAVIEQVWPTGRYCALGGSAFDLPSGNVLVGCAEDNEALEVDENGEVLWALHLDCRGGDIGALPRFVPVSLLPEVESD